MFLSGLEPEQTEFELPKEEFKKLHDVLRLRSGAQIAIVPGDGRFLRCELRGHSAVLLAEETVRTEARLRVTLAQAMPRPEKLEEVLRMATEIGVAQFFVFDSDRTVVRWDAKKWTEKERRLGAIVRESAEVACRLVLPPVRRVESLAWVLAQPDPCIVLSEVEDVSATLPAKLAQVQGDAVTLVIGPEGGWSPREVAQIGDRAATLGPRVMRVDTAAAAACALALN